MLHIDDVKKHLRIFGDCEDDYLAALVLGACKLFETNTHRKLVRPQELPKNDPRAVELDELITVGILLTVGHWYENREASSSLNLREIPMGVSACWAPYTFHNVS